MDKAGPGIAQEHPPGLGQDARLGGLVSLLGNRVRVEFPWSQIPDFIKLNSRQDYSDLKLANQGLN